MRNIFLLSFAFLTVGLFALGIYLEKNSLIPWKNYDYKFLEDYSYVNATVVSSSKDHGFVLLNDSNMVWGGNQLIRSSSSNKSNQLKNKMLKMFGDDSSSWTVMFELVSEPYKIIKYPHDTVFFVIQDSDSLIFDFSPR